MPTHRAHDNARSASSSSEKCSLHRLNGEVFVVAQPGVFGAEAVRRNSAARRSCSLYPGQVRHSSACS